jgi:membrane-associated phospholipid phosphatase
MNSFENMFNLFRKPWLLLIGLAVIVCSFLWLDLPLTQYFRSLNLDAAIPILKYITMLGIWIDNVILFLVLIIIFTYAKRNPLYEQRCRLMFTALIFTGLAGTIVKVILGRSRPELFFSSHLYGLYWFKFKPMYWSMPSGHSWTAFTLAFVGGVIFRGYFYAFIAIAIAVAATRVILCHHYLSDIIVGFYISLFVVGYFLQFVKHKRYFALV